MRILDMSRNKVLPIIGLTMLLVTALALAGSAAYQSIIGLADLFAARKEVVIVMAVFIEWAKLLFAGALHMFWHGLGWWKWIAVGIVAVHMAVTNIGIYAYLSSGYTLQEAPVAALEREIGILQGKLTSLATIESEAVRGIQAMDTAYERLVEGTYVTRAERYQRENAEKRAELEAQRDEVRAEMRETETVIADLEEQKIANAAKLGSIEHISAFVGSDPDDVLKVVAFFTILLMMGLDPAALLMVVLFSHLLSKWMKDNEEEKPVEEEEALPAEVVSEAKRLHEIGYLDNRRKKQGKMP